MKSTKIAYFLWLIGLFGCLGLHQMYIKNYEKGILYCLTFGGFGFGAIYDFFYMNSQIVLASQPQQEQEFLQIKPFKEREIWVDLYEG